MKTPPNRRNETPASAIRGAVAACLLVVACVSGCGANIVRVPYTPAPERVANPSREAGLLIVANVSPGCIAEPKFNEIMMQVEYVCRGAIGNMVMRFDKVDSIALEKSGEWYRVLVHHRDGIEDFAWTSKSLEDMKHLADALSALAKGPAADTKASKTAGSI